MKLTDGSSPPGSTMTETILPPASSLSPSVISFIDDKLHNKDDQDASTLVLELQYQCNALDQSLSDLTHTLQSYLFAYASYSDHFTSLITAVNEKLTDLHSFTGTADSLSDGRGRSEHILGEELPALAKEVARVEATRSYAETTLKLNTLVGDIEDVVWFIVNRNLRKRPSSHNLEEVRLVAIKALKQAEDVLASVTKTRPQWARLVLAVDHRVGRALAILRPQAIADHRSLLASLGWPPSLSSLCSPDPDTKKSPEV